MPRNRVQGIIFGVLMSVTMAYGMEVYNVAWKMGIPTMPGGFSNMTNDVFLSARLVDPGHDNAFLCTVVRSSCTVLIMCPTMSMVASILFNVILGGMPIVQLPAIFVGTLIKKFPMALLWNLFAAGPISRLVFAKCFSHVGEKQEEAAPEGTEA